MAYNLLCFFPNSNLGFFSNVGSGGGHSIFFLGLIDGFDFIGIGIGMGLKLQKEKRKKEAVWFIGGRAYMLHTTFVTIIHSAY
jgi:hypothetical protein